ncbi:hypothetical protein [Carboxylicivirga sp. RSCT41]|uniref:hypothetical protein n=1 Tax=Carboxylicivirga agarovorans TaxID=3417570 RepID=UPI003D356199
MTRIQKDMKLFSNFIEKNSTGKKVLWLFLFTNVVYVFMLAVTIPKTMDYSNGLKLLDMMPGGYDMDYVVELFSSLGEEGREFYLTKQIPVDFIYPVLFGLSYCLLLGYFLKKLNTLKSPLRYLCLIPLIAGISDYIENIGIITMLNSYPDLTSSSVAMVSSFSMIKSISTSVYFVILLIVLVCLGFVYLKKRKSGAV